MEPLNTFKHPRTPQRTARKHGKALLIPTRTYQQEIAFLVKQLYPDRRHRHQAIKTKILPHDYYEVRRSLPASLLPKHETEISVQPMTTENSPKKNHMVLRGIHGRC